MSIKRVEFRYKKRGLRYDSRKALWAGYQVDLRIGKKRMRPLFPTKQQAEAFCDRVHDRRIYDKAGLSPRAARDVMLEDVFNAVLRNAADKKSHIRANRVFNAFMSLFDAPPKITDVRSVHFRLFIKMRLNDGVSSATVNREITVLSPAFTNAEMMFPVELEGYEPPQIKRLPERRGKRSQHEITHNERERLIFHILNDRLPREKRNRILARPVIADLFDLGWLLGVRYGELTKLVKSDLRGESLRVVRWKTRSVSIIEPLPSEVLDILLRNIDRSDTDLIFAIPCSHHTVLKVIQQACSSAGIEYGRSAIDGVTFHSTRHSFTSRLVRVTDIATAGSFTGHSSKEMVDYYAHTSPDAKRQAMERLYGARRDLPEIYAAVRSGEMSYDEFRDALNDI